MTMLAIYSSGQGPDLILLHGWATHSGIWSPLIPLLTKKFTLHLVDLPGFGESEYLPTDNIEDWIKLLCQYLPRQAIWLGWSLGGLLAQYIALLRPEWVSRLITVCSSAAFCQDSDWPGIPLEQLAFFQQSCQLAPNKTVERFLLSQNQPSPTARTDHHLLKTLLSGKPSACHPLALQQGLTLLRSTDLRQHIHAIHQPWLQLFGHYDPLIPINSMTAHAKLSPNADQYCFYHSAHMPFISESEKFIKVVCYECETKSCLSRNNSNYLNKS